LPKYDYACPECGVFEQHGGYDATSVKCACGLRAKRQAVYSQAVIFKGGGFTKTVLPPPGDPAEASIMQGELKKRGWDADRAISELRENTVTDEEGNRSIDLAGMTQTA